MIKKYVNNLFNVRVWTFGILFSNFDTKWFPVLIESATSETVGIHYILLIR